MATRLGAVVVATLAAVAPSLASAQGWSVQSGATARAEYNDNYFFTAVNQTPGVTPQSAFTASISPFVTAARRTETSDVTALLAVGANRVWGPSPTTDYLSGRFVLDGSLREARATWSGNVSFARAPSLQNVVGDTGTILALAYTNAATANGTYTYALTEQWSLGATVGAYGNRYDSVNSSASGTPSSNLSNNHGYSAGGNAGYAYSDRSQLTFLAVYLQDTSNVARTDSVTTTLGVVHQFSPQLTISASLGYYWADIEATQGDAVTSDRRRPNGALYGGSISYAFSERTQFNASLSEGLAPSSTGTLSKSDIAVASLTQKFSERFNGRLGASYTRSINPTTTGSSTTNNYAGQVGVSYQLADRWKLDAGYQYARARYSQNAFEPKSNLVFVSIGYNWPGASFTDWVGTRPDTLGLPGAGPVSLPERSPSSARPPGTPPEASPFDRFTIP
jgi:hypothetical protein